MNINITVKYSQAAIRYITRPTKAEAAVSQAGSTPLPTPEDLRCQPFKHGRRFDSRINLNGRVYHLGMHSELILAQRAVMAAQWRQAQVDYCLPEWQKVSDKPLVTNTFLVGDRERLRVGTAEEFDAIPSIRQRLLKIEQTTRNPPVPGSEDDRRKADRRELNRRKKRPRRMRDQEKYYAE